MKKLRCGLLLASLGLISFASAQPLTFSNFCDLSFESTNKCTVVMIDHLSAGHAKIYYSGMAKTDDARLFLTTAVEVVSKNKEQHPNEPEYIYHHSVIGAQPRGEQLPYIRFAKDPNNYAIDIDTPTDGDHEKTPLKICVTNKGTLGWKDAQGKTPFKVSHGGYENITQLSAALGLVGSLTHVGDVSCNNGLLK